MSQRDGEYETEGVDRLPFSTPEKAQRYQTESYRGAVGLNWYLTDPRCDRPWRTTCNPTSWRSSNRT